MMSLSKCFGVVAVTTATLANAHNFNLTFDGASHLGSASGDCGVTKAWQACGPSVPDCPSGEGLDCPSFEGQQLVCGINVDHQHDTTKYYYCGKKDQTCGCPGGDCPPCAADTTTTTYHGPPTTTTTVKPEHGGSGKCGPNQDQYCRGVNAAGLDMASDKSPEGDFAAPDVDLITQHWLSKTALTASGAKVVFDEKVASQNVIRLPFTWERACQSAINCLKDNGWELNGPHASDIMNTVHDLLTKTNVTVILDPHNNTDGVSFNQVTATHEEFAALWTGLASWVKHMNFQNRVIMELYNEPRKSKDQNGAAFTVDEWSGYVKAAIAAIREQDPDHNSLILVPGVNWEGAHNWTDTNTNLLNTFTDSNWAFVMHQYFDTGFAGTSSNCDANLHLDSATKGFGGATKWLEDNNVQAFLTEFGLVGPYSDDCKQKWNGMLGMMEQSPGWLGYTSWNIVGAAGTDWEGMQCNMMKNDGTLYGAASWLVDVN